MSIQFKHSQINIIKFNIILLKLFFFLIMIKQIDTTSIKELDEYDYTSI